MAGACLRRRGMAGTVSSGELDIESSNFMDEDLQSGIAGTAGTSYGERRTRGIAGMVGTAGTVSGKIVRA